MRNSSKSAMLRMPSLLESRNSLLHLREHLLRENQSSRSILPWTLDLLSIANYVIKNGRPHGHRFGKTKEQRDHHIAHNFRKRCIKRGFEGIHDRFQKDPTFRESQLEILRSEEVCIQMDKDARRKMSTFDTKRMERFLVELMTINKKVRN